MYIYIHISLFIVYNAITQTFDFTIFRKEGKRRKIVNSINR